MNEAIKKRRILVWADSPTVATGFAQVSRNILRELHKTGKYEIDMIGINYRGEFDRQKFEENFGFIDRIVPAQQLENPDMYGREFLVMTLAGHNPTLQPPYDIFFSIQDHFIIHQKDGASRKGLGQAIKNMQANTLKAKEFRDNHFLWVGYFPVDGELKEHWVDEAIATCDYPVAYCEYGASQILKFDSKERQLEGRLKIIYHGTNIKDFYPVDRETKNKWRQELFPELKESTHLILNVARNQPRKDLFRTLVVYKSFLKEHEDSLLYMHCDPNDPSGGNLVDMCRYIGLDLNKILLSPRFSAHRGVSIEKLNKIYNAADAFLTTTLGEGWGLPITEAMACKLPVYAPNITSIQDILGTNEGWNPQIARGMAFLAGSNLTEWVNFGRSDNEVPRPITNVDSAVAMLKWGFENKDKVKEITERAYEWVLEHTWEKETQKWVAVFDEACAVNDELRKNTADAVEKVGRNDMCPICKDKKIKKCKLHKDIYLK